MQAYEAFLARWKERLNEQASMAFAISEPSPQQSTYGAVADAFVAPLNLKPLGFNWEMLDPHAAPDEPRSALGTIADAFARNMEFPSRDWLGEAGALACAGDFLGLFDAGEPTILSNRLGDLWNPLTQARIEWGFVGFDEERIVLMLATL